MLSKIHSGGAQFRSRQVFYQSPVFHWQDTSWRHKDGHWTVISPMEIQGNNRGWRICGSVLPSGRAFSADVQSTAHAFRKVPGRAYSVPCMGSISISFPDTPPLDPEVSQNPMIKIFQEAKFYKLREDNTFVLLDAYGRDLMEFNGIEDWPANWAPDSEKRWG